MNYDTAFGIMRLFGSSGIRGLANKDITAELAINLGEVLGTLHKSVVVGHDPRTSSQLLLHAVSSGLLSTGSGVFMAGMVTTPTLAYAARTFDCGVMITASHNPPEYNGVKFFNPDGSGFGVEQMLTIEEMLAKKNIHKAQRALLRLLAEKKPLRDNKNGAGSIMLKLTEIFQGVSLGLYEPMVEPLTVYQRQAT